MQIPTAKAALESFRLAPGVHVLGLMERGVTIYNQQVRAHNFAWALKKNYEKEKDPGRIAVLGGGISGLTVSACLLNAFSSTKIVVFEKRLDLCPIQQGADHRWIHPHIYEWPDIGSDRPSTGLPLMRWEAGRASDVVHKILEQFRSTFKEFTTRIDVVLGAEHVKLSVDKKSLEWIGQKSKEIEGFYVADGGAGKTECFDEIVVATGFGLETVPAGHANTSYWRNEQASQPILGSSPSRILISGYGDGALTDLFRLTIERFRQETILREIFKDQKQLQIAELKLRRVKASNYSADQLFSAFENELDELDNVSEQLAHRLRKDTKVYLHLSGPSNKNTSLVDAFGRTSSFLNRFMLFLLYRCGAFVPVFGELDSCIAALNISPRHVLCRHGTSTKDDFKSLLSGGHLDYYMASLEKIRAAQMQGPQPWFEPGFFQPEKWKKS